ncbi:MAG: deoxyribonuclease IV [Candidatus Krumholzibacteria bacterium]|nr:deoxyribonuclease IV [Candidatus Krumholzibacteria bacterium]
MNLGAHMSIAGGIHLALERGRSIGCNAVQLFVKSSNQWKARPLPAEEISLFHEKAREYRSGFIMGHSSYLINIASPDAELLEKSRKALAIEIERCETLSIPWLVLHPGSHRGAGTEAGIRTVAESLDRVFEMTAGYKTSILLETTSGSGNILGSRFEELAAIIGLLQSPARIGVCLDTCHIFAAGYDISTKKDYNAVFKSFDSIIGLNHLKAFHLNDSKTPLGSGKDRHANIGEGEIGVEPFGFLVNDPRFIDIPMVLETPKGPDLAEDVETLALLRSLRKKKKS